MGGGPLYERGKRRRCGALEVEAERGMEGQLRTSARPCLGTLSTRTKTHHQRAPMATIVRGGQSLETSTVPHVFFLLAAAVPQLPG